MVKEIPKVKFNDGKEIPILGLGTWNSKPGEVKKAVKVALDAGYRHLDCAFCYQNEREVGEALAEVFKEGKLTREDVFITSKLWNTFHQQESVIPGLKTTLKDLQLDYIDLYLIHWPMGYKEGEDLFPRDEDGNLIYSDANYVDTWKGMEECVNLGLAKSIGVSNFNSSQIENILANCSIKPVNNQVECHPYLNQNKLIEYCLSKNITITAYSPLGSPARPFDTSKAPVLMEDAKLKEIAGKYKTKSIAHILIRYQIQRGVICIPKSVTPERIIQNFNVFDFKLSAEDMAAIDGLDCQERYLLLEGMADHPHYPFKIEF